MRQRRREGPSESRMPLHAAVLSIYLGTRFFPAFHHGPRRLSTLRRQARDEAEKRAETDFFRLPQA